MRTSDNRTPPIPNSYWVRRGRLAAGEYPGSFERREAANKLSVLFESGIDHFIDLTHPADGLKPYHQTAEQEARRLGKTVEWERHPIFDLSVPRNPEEMKKILDAIDDALNHGRTVYVHCWGGGRTDRHCGWLLAGSARIHRWRGPGSSWGAVRRDGESSLPQRFSRNASTRSLRPKLGRAVTKGMTT